MLSRTGSERLYLKDIVLCRESGCNVLSALTRFVNSVLAGSCPQDFGAYFICGRLLALSKTSGGIRSSVVGLIIRRQVCKCANSYIFKLLVPFFHLSVACGLNFGL